MGYFSESGMESIHKNVNTAERKKRIHARTLLSDACNNKEQVSNKCSKVEQAQALLILMTTDMVIGIVHM